MKHNLASICPSNLAIKILACMLMALPAISACKSFANKPHYREADWEKPWKCREAKADRADFALNVGAGGRIAATFDNIQIQGRILADGESASFRWQKAALKKRGTGRILLVGQDQIAVKWGKSSDATLSERSWRCGRDRSGDLTWKRYSRSRHFADAQSEFNAALQMGYYKIALQLLKKNGAINVNYEYPLNGYPRSVIHFAADNLDLLKLVVERGARLETRTWDGYTALALAAEFDLIDQLEYLKSQRADINAVAGYGHTPLWMAACPNPGMEVNDTAHLLVRWGADPNPVSTLDGRFPLLCAVQEDNYDLLIALLDKGANPNLKNARGQSALSEARIANRKKFEKTLLGRGARE